MAAKVRGSSKGRSSRVKTAIEQRRAVQRQLIDADFRARHPRKAAEERALRVAQVEQQRDWGHKANGTVETHAKNSRRREGALARMYQSGAIDVDQLEWAREIAAQHQLIGAEVAVNTASLETRVDRSRAPADMFFESLGRVRRAVAYSRWRAALPEVCEGLGARPVLAMIIDDVGIAAVSRSFGIHRRRAKRILIAAIDLWPSTLCDTARDIDQDELDAVERRLA